MARGDRREEVPADHLDAIGHTGRSEELCGLGDDVRQVEHHAAQLGLEREHAFERNSVW